MSLFSFVGFELILVIISLILVIIVMKRLYRTFSKANERLIGLKNTNKVLDQLLCQLGVRNCEEITIKELATGRVSSMQLDEWIKLKSKRKYAMAYEVVKNSN